MTKMLTIALLGGCMSLAAVVLAPRAEAVVYCKAVGVPKGCVARAPSAAIYCTRPGYPVGCVGGAARVATPGVGAPGVGVQPMNRGGPVNRVGVR